MKDRRLWFGLVLLAWIGLLSGCQDRSVTTARLQAMANELLPRLEALSGLEAIEPVRVEVQDSAAVRAYVEEQLDDDLDREELEGARATYVALGLLPDTLDLHALLLDIYTEQVVGYYDPERERLYVIEHADIRDAAPVLAHELVHALQGQHAPLPELIAPERGNDRRSAAQAALEGHATLVMFALAMEQGAGGPIDLRQLPDMRAQLEPVLEAQNDAFPIFRDAPRILREAMLFPYISGAGYAQALWNTLGPIGGETDPAAMRWPAPLDSLLPTSTRQVLRPYEAFLEDRIEPVELRFTSEPDDWRIVYENTLGQLELEIMLAEHLGEGARADAGGWLGDRFALLEAPDGGRALVLFTVWDDAEDADAFAEAYRRTLDRRAELRHGRVERIALDGLAAVRIVDAERGVSLDAVPVPDGTIAEVEEPFAVRP